MLKRFVFLFIFAFANIVFAHAETLSMEWLNEDGTVYTTSTCESGGDVILPAIPTKTGYTFMGWVKYYTPIEYLESTGTQCIDTGVVFDTSMERLDYNLKISFQNTTSEKRVLDNQVSDSSGFNVGFANNKFYVYSGIYRADSDNMSYSEPSTSVFETEGYFQSSGFKNNFMANASQSITYIPQTNSNIYIFGTCGKSSLYSGRFYFAKIKIDNILIRDFIPVLDGDGVPCMYDKVTRQFFYNQGTGQFIAGPVLNE